MRVTQATRLRDQLAAAEERLKAQDEAHKSELAAYATKALEAEDKMNSSSERWREEKNCFLEQVLRVR